MRIWGILMLIGSLCPTAPVYAEDIVFCKSDDVTVPGRVERYISSADTPKFRTSDVILSPDLAAVRGLPPLFWKCSVGKVIPMTLGEMASIRAALPSDNPGECNPTSRGRQRVLVSPDGAGADKLQACMRGDDGVLKWQTAEIESD